MSYAGCKRGWHVPSGFDFIYDFCMGGGGYTYAALKTNPGAIVVGAESNPIQRAVLKWVPSAAWNIAERWLLVLRSQARNGSSDYWRTIVKPAWNDAYSSGRVTNEAIAAQMLALSYGYEGKTPTSEKGLNVSPLPAKLLSDPLEKPLSFPEAHIYDRFQDFEIQKGEKSIALLDLPYALPRYMAQTHKLLTSCYPGHKPYSPDAMDLYHTAIEKAVKANCSEIRIANYHSPEMHDLAFSFPGYHAVAIHHPKRHRTPSSVNHRFVHGGRSAKAELIPLEEYEWVLVKDKSRLPIVYQQPSLLEVA